MTRWHLRHAVHGDKAWAVQVEALKRAEGRDRYGYFLEQGLGKTSLTLNDFIDQNDVDLNIVIAPQTFKYDWYLAPEEWGVGFLDCGVWPNHPLPFKVECGLYAVNYEAVSRSQITKPLIELLDSRRCMLTIDESKALGNPRSGFTKSVIELAKRAKVVRELNGTPITQNPMDYYGQLRALGELNGMNPVSFRNRFAVLGGYMGRQILHEIKNGDQLAAILNRCSFRALKSEWRKDLPPKTYSLIHLEMTNRQLQHYRSMMEEFYALVDGQEIMAEIVLAQMDKLRQISSGIIHKDGEPIVFEPAETNPKIRAVKQIIGEGYGKGIVIHHYRESGALLEKALEKLQPAVIRGRMKPEAVRAEKDRFNNDSNCRVLIGQEQAVALGHTLLGQKGSDRCNKTVFFENGFSYYYRSQVEDRIHRGEQDQTASMIDLVTSPMDETVVKILTSKRDMAQSMDELIDMVRKLKRERK